MSVPNDRFRNYLQQQKALSFRNYRLFVVGQTFSLIGTWIQRMAMMWLVYRMTNSAFLLGLVGFCEQIPILILAPFAGVYADRWNKHKALSRIDTLAMLQALVLGLLTLFHMVAVWHLVLLSLLLGMVNAFEVPVRQSFVVDMVGRDRYSLQNAIALNSTVFNLSRLIGPSIAGILIGSLGEGWCFMANALSYAIVVTSLLMMRNMDVVDHIKKQKYQVLVQLKEGFQYVRNVPMMKSLLVVLAIVSFANASIRTLGSVFAKDVLHGDAGILGILMSAVGVGAIAGALFLTKNRSGAALKRIVSFTGIFLGMTMIAFGASSWLPLSLIFLALCGLAQMMHTATTNTLLQLKVDDDKRGRVMSFYTVCLQGTMPIGSLVAGSLAGWFGGPWAITIMGLACLLGALFFKEKNLLRHWIKEIKARKQ
ncbi:MAG TPA: MFS transporter [Edaphocola sp.]|nr:MFS transporter [Edaphocola sp.]